MAIVPADHVPPGAAVCPGAVIIPPALAAVSERRFATADEWLMRLNGVMPNSPEVDELREELRAAARTASGQPAVILRLVAERSWLTVSEAADVMGVIPRSVRRLARGQLEKPGRIRARRAGRDWQIDRQSAEDYGRERRDSERVSHRRAA